MICLANGVYWFLICILKFRQEAFTFFSLANLNWFVSNMQREVYPTLVLFPAEKKKPLLYEGDIAVVDVIKFLAEHASYFNRVISDKGNLAQHTLLLCVVYHK